MLGRLVGRVEAALTRLHLAGELGNAAPPPVGAGLGAWLGTLDGLGNKALYTLVRKLRDTQVYASCLRSEEEGERAEAEGERAEGEGERAEGEGKRAELKVALKRAEEGRKRAQEERQAHRWLSSCDSTVVGLVAYAADAAAYDAAIDGAASHAALADALPPCVLEVDCVGSHYAVDDLGVIEIGEILCTGDSRQWQHGARQLIRALRAVRQAQLMCAPHLKKSPGVLAKVRLVGVLFVPADEASSEAVAESLEAITSGADVTLKPWLLRMVAREKNKGCYYYYD